MVLSCRAGFHTYPQTAGLETHPTKIESLKSIAATSLLASLSWPQRSQRVRNSPIPAEARYGNRGYLAWLQQPVAGLLRVASLSRPRRFWRVCLGRDIPSGSVARPFPQERDMEIAATSLDSNSESRTRSLSKIGIWESQLATDRARRAKPQPKHLESIQEFAQSPVICPSLRNIPRRRTRGVRWGRG
jgi:hypothetical protein